MNIQSNVQNDKLVNFNVQLVSYCAYNSSSFMSNGSSMLNVKRLVSRHKT